MDIQIGKYKRPGIYTEYEDQSIFTNPTQGGISSLILGFSKKGPFNTPIYLENVADREKIFGPLDRNLERKGSFFHRTIDKTLELSPVYAINLLATDDELDRVQYRSISTQTSLLNGALKSGPYRRIYDTTGFWRRDEQAFLSMTNSSLTSGAQTNEDKPLLHFTNVSGNPITIFVFKTKLTGFDRTLIEWYGSVEKMPPYLNESDYASDYMVDVLVVGGDWSDYNKLSVDTRWSKYFTIDGLKKDQVYNFAYDKNVNTLKYYEGLSMIPYFRDSYGNNIFLEHRINADTNTTGLFCAFDSDRFESTDNYSGMVDLIGNGITAGTVSGEVEFLSYKFNLGETLEYSFVKSDRVGNVLSFGNNSNSEFYHDLTVTFTNDVVSITTGEIIKGGVKHQIEASSLTVLSVSDTILTVNTNSELSLFSPNEVIPDSEFMIGEFDTNDTFVPYNIADLFTRDASGIKLNSGLTNGQRVLANRVISLLNQDNRNRVRFAAVTTNGLVSLTNGYTNIVESGSIVGFNFGEEVVSELYFIDDEFTIENSVLTARPSSKFYIDYINGVITSGDKFVDNIDNTENETVMYIDNNGALIANLTGEYNNSPLKVISGKSNFVQNLDVAMVTDYIGADNKILLLSSRYSEVKVGDFLEAEEGSPRNVARILSKRVYANNTDYVEVSTDLPIKKVEIANGIQVKRFTKIEDYVSTYNGITLSGFNVREESMPNGTESRQNQILNIVAQGTHLFKAITNKETFDFRYLIDSFGLGLTENSKQQLVDICGSRLDCFGFINMPSMRDFRNSSSPSFVDADGIIKMEYIALGANPESNPAFNYSFATGDGVTAVGYFFPYVKVNSEGVQIEVPPAMYVANTYLRKHRSTATNVTPWTISAGITNGRVLGISGLELELSGDDIAHMMSAQMNPIVWKRNRGYVIESENTALTLYKSTLGSIHVREALIELERELSAMLLNYQWSYNTAEVRAEIKLKADVICQNYVTKNGFYAFFNKCDEENNPRELIENEIGLLHTYVEPVMGLKILVNKITILRNGTIESAGFMEQFQ